jgi:hypothetical protein
MAWTIELADDSRYLIMDKDRLVGSIARKQLDAEEYQEHFRVEISWSGTGADITYEGKPRRGPRLRRRRRGDV